MLSHAHSLALPDWTSYPVFESCERADRSWLPLAKFRSLRRYKVFNAKSIRKNGFERCVESRACHIFVALRISALLISRQSNEWHDQRGGRWRFATSFHSLQLNEICNNGGRCASGEMKCSGFQKSIGPGLHLIAGDSLPSASRNIASARFDSASRRKPT